MPHTMSVPQEELARTGVSAESPVAAAAPVPAAAAPAPPLFDRELSWLEFNRRVLGEAQNPDVPLLERVKFLAIASNNLDEFFMIRVGEVRDLLTASEGTASFRTLTQKLDRVRTSARRLIDDMYRCWSDDLIPLLEKQKIRIERVADLVKRDRAGIEESFTRNIEPILTPLALDPGHPFPFITNLALNLAVELESQKGDSYVVLVKIPEQAPRLVPLPEAGHFVLLEDVISSHIERFFPGLKLKKAIPFRVIRNSDLSIKEDDIQDLLKTVETELRRRERREVVWLEIGAGSDEGLVNLLIDRMQSSREDVYFAPGPLKLSNLMQLYEDEANHVKLKDPPFNPRIPAQLATSEDIFSIIRRGDVLLHRPYDSYTAVVEYVQTAASDPDVKAIKQTLYRTDADSPVIEALADAAAAGKQVTAVVELQARFDEQKNITWAKRLEESGVQVVYGLVGLKTHCKVCLVVRRESDGLRRYVHLSTGNYNANTGRLYTDLDLFTCDAEFGADAAQLMNLLTGYSVAGVQELIERADRPLRWRRFVVSPLDYLPWVLDMVQRETRNARERRPARITAKMNALVDPDIIAALYEAADAGVRIDLLVRGICCLVPRENILVMSVIDRFLEHSRVFRFENGGAPEFYISSGDWMPRNLIRRVEVTYPIKSEPIIRRIDQQILPISLADNVKSWILEPDGRYQRRKIEGPPVRSQESFIAIARAEAVKLGPYDEILRQPESFRRKARRKKK